MRDIDKSVIETLRKWTSLQEDLQWEYPYGPTSDACISLPAPDNFSDISPTLFRLTLHEAFRSSGFTAPEIHAEKLTRYYELQTPYHPSYYYPSLDKTEVIPAEESPLVTVKKGLVSQKSECEVTIDVQPNRVQRCVTYIPVIYPDRMYFERDAEKCYAHVAVDDKNKNSLVLYTTHPEKINFAEMRRNYVRIAAQRSLEKLGEKNIHLPLPTIRGRVLKKQSSSSHIETQLSYIKKVAPFFENFYSQLENIYNTATEEKVTTAFSIPVPNFNWKEACALCVYLNEAQDKTLIKGFSFRYDMEDRIITCHITDAETKDIAPQGDLALKFYTRTLEMLQNPHVSREEEKKRLPVEMEYALQEFYQKLTLLYNTELAKEPKPVTVTATFTICEGALPQEVKKTIIHQLNHAQAITKIENITFSSDGTCTFTDVPLGKLEPKGELRNKVKEAFKGKNIEQWVM